MEIKRYIIIIVLLFGTVSNTWRTRPCSQIKTTHYYLGHYLSFAAGEERNLGPKTSCTWTFNLWYRCFWPLQLIPPSNASIATSMHIPSPYLIPCWSHASCLLALTLFTLGECIKQNYIERGLLYFHNAIQLSFAQHDSWIINKVWWLWWLYWNSLACLHFPMAKAGINEEVCPFGVICSPL